MNPKVRSIGDRALDRTMRARRPVTIVSTIRLTTNRPNPAINCANSALLTIGLTAISTVLKPKTVIAAAPTQAMIDNASRTKPRAKAKIADNTMMAMTPRSSGFMAGSWRDRDPARGTFRRRDKPAARRRQARHELAQMADLDSPQPLRTCRPAAGWPLRDPGLGKAKLGGFLEARFGVADRPHPTGETDLAKDDGIGGEGGLGQGRHERCRDREIGGRLNDAQPAGDIQVDVVGADRETATRVEHRREHCQARRVPADHGATRGAEQRWSDERLHLDQERPGALDAGEHRSASGATARLRIGRVVAVSKEQCRGVRHLDEAAIAHLEDADLIGRAKAVFYGAQDAELVTAFAFEIEHGVDHVLEDARAGDQPFLRHVSYQHDDKAAALGEADQFLRRAAHLADRAGGAVERVEIHRLDRIDDDEIGRLGRIERIGDVANAARGGETDRAVGDPEPLGAQPDLVDRFFAGDVGRRAAARGEGGGRLQQQGRFADPGIAADEDRRAGNQAAAADPVELGDAGQTPWRSGRLAAQADKIDCWAAAAACGAAEALWRSAARHLLDEAVPGAAGLAPPGPFRREGAALLAGVAGLRLGHARLGGAGSCGADLHLDRSFGAAMDKLIDERVVAAVDLARRALPNDAPLVQHRDAVGNPARADHVVSDRNRRRAELAHRADDQPVDDIGHDRVEAGGRLVEEHDLGLGGDRAGERDPLLHPARQLGRAQRRDFRAEADGGKFFERDLARCGAIHTAALDEAKGDVFPDAQRIEQRAALKQHAEFAHDLLAPAAAQPDGFRAIDSNRSGLGPHDPEDTLDQHRFSGARAADDDEALTGRDCEVDAVEHALPAKRLLDSDEGDFRGGCVAHREKNAWVSA